VVGEPSPQANSRPPVVGVSTAAATAWACVVGLVVACMAAGLAGALSSVVPTAYGLPARLATGWLAGMPASDCACVEPEGGLPTSAADCWVGEALAAVQPAVGGVLGGPPAVWRPRRPGAGGARDDPMGGRGAS